MTTILLQAALHLSLGAYGGLGDDVNCVYNWDCNSGQCNNPYSDGDGGWLFVCCEPLGTSCDVGTPCCTYGSIYVGCDLTLGPDNGFCGIMDITPGVDAGLLICTSADDCPEIAAGYNFEFASQCGGEFVADAGAGVFEKNFWLPFDAGDQPIVLPDGGFGTPIPFVLTQSSCETCWQPSQSIGTFSTAGLDQPCSQCCSGQCFKQTGGPLNNDAICCSGPGQICRNDNDCCYGTENADWSWTDTGQTQSCFLVESCDYASGQFCNDAGQVGFCALIDGQQCTQNSQCRSGECDAGFCYRPC